MPVSNVELYEQRKGTVMQCSLVQSAISMHARMLKHTLSLVWDSILYTNSHEARLSVTHPPHRVKRTLDVPGCFVITGLTSATHDNQGSKDTAQV